MIWEAKTDNVFICFSVSINEVMLHTADSKGFCYENLGILRLMRKIAFLIIVREKYGSYEYRFAF